MLSGVVQLVDGYGELTGVQGVAGPAGRWRRIVFYFSSGSLDLSCVDDTDEICVTAGDSALDDQVPVEELADLIGLRIEYAWELRNHRGYTDGFQLRFVDQDGRAETRQFEVAASAIDIRRVGRE